ncbi:MAG: hypothetical protein J6P91_06690 [Methanobrevibacter sp.]|nr:hypothetical protein [Methanobrevibacter sp.]
MLLIFILSVSAVSADSMDESSLALVYDDFSNMSDNETLNSPLEEALNGNLNEDLDDNLDDYLDENDNSEYNLEDNVNPEITDSDDESDDEEHVLKDTSLEIISQDDWKIYGNEDYYVKLVDEDGNPISDALIYFRIEDPKGVCAFETAYTDVDGIAILSLDLSMRGIHNIQVSYYGDLDYNSAESVYSNVILYEMTEIQTPKEYAYISSDFTIKLVESNGNPLSNKELIIYVDGVEYIKTTDEDGLVYVKMPSDRNSVNFTCFFDGGDYFEQSTLSMTLPVYKKTYTKPLIYTILKGNCFKILLKGADGKILKKEKVKFTINGKTYTRTTWNTGIAYIRLKLSRGKYKISFSYDNNGVYGPSSNSSTLEIIDPSGQFKKGLNQNTKRSVSKYKYGGGYAKITKSIRKLSKKLTSKYSTKLEKATAIFNYVRDNLGYSYYANSKKGAAKTLKTKRGNCCDHSNLIVALCRASKIPARYAHAKGCRFGSGFTTGHVWAQIYVNGRWYSADGTSYRNSLGHIKNWNTKSYKRLRIYRNIPF